MKTRNSFVSNSSSSSFILGVAKVANLSEATVLVETANKPYNIFIVSTTELLEASESKFGSLDLANGKGVLHLKESKYTKPNTYRLESFQSDLDFEIDPAIEEHFLCLSYIGNEGDLAFDSADNDWESIYDIELDFFEKGIQEAAISIMCGTNGLEKGHCSWGAGRDG